AEQPVAVTEPVQSVLPAGEPDARVKLDGLTAYGPQEVAVTKTDGASVRRVLGSSDYPQITMGAYTIVCWTEEETGITHFSYGRTDGNVGESTFYDFLVCPALEGGYEYQVEKFYNLLGHSGFAVTYLGGEDLEPKDPAQSGSSLYTVRRYYDFDGDSLKLLATTVGGDDQRADLDGDGSNELFFNSNYSLRLDPSYNFYFHRQGTTYALDLREIAFELFPDWSYVATGIAENGCIPVTGAYQREDGAYVDAFRYMYFTGDELLFYKDSRETVDHVMGTPDVPADVLEMVKREVEQLYTSGEFNSPGYDAGYDDWRIEYLALDETYSFTGGDVEVYNLNFEFHASKPENVMLAGGMYHSEEDWVMPSYPNCFYIYVVNENGARRHLKTAMVNDGSPGVDWFDSEVYNMAMEEGLTTMADLEGILLLQTLATDTVRFLDTLARMSPEEQDRIASKICYYRTSGPEENQQLYQETMQALVGWNTYELTTAQYDAWAVLTNYHICQPAELTEAERYAALDAANSYMWAMGESEACLEFDLKSTAIDDAET
ncbi:MAG: hypothetical protein IJZ66_01595, partial [Oscillibacter sp.]|nr:hypothetical protein [Oscillibacter sp.]